MSRGKQTLTFISGVVFSGVRFKQIISSGKLEGLRKKNKTDMSSIIGRWIGLIKHKFVSVVNEVKTWKPRLSFILKHDFVSILSQTFKFVRF